MDVLGHPTGRRLLKREPAQMDMAAVVAAAKARGVAMEINCQPERLDLSDTHARLARDRGVSLIISTDAHSVAALDRLRWGCRWRGARGFVPGCPQHALRSPFPQEPASSSADALTWPSPPPGSFR